MNHQEQQGPSTPWYLCHDAQEKEQDVYSKTWFLGKELQSEAHLMNSAEDHLRKDSSVSAISTCSSLLLFERHVFLSPRVHRLVVFDLQSTRAEMMLQLGWSWQRFSTQEGTLEWALLTKQQILGSSSSSVQQSTKDEDADFEMAAPFAHKLALLAHEWLLSLDHDRFERLYGRHFSVLPELKVQLFFISIFIIIFACTRWLTKLILLLLLLHLLSASSS